MPQARPSPITRPPRRADLGPVLWFVHSVLVSLALMNGSWRFEPVEVDPYAPVRPVPAVPAGLVVQDVTQTPATPVRTAVPVSQPDLPAALRSLAPREGQTLFVDSETLWLARCIYSESDRPHEQELVAWVVRNRVATAYRGRRSYEGVVLDPRQFSAFNAGAPRRAFYKGLMPASSSPGWRRALLIAAYVRQAPWSRRPFSVTTRHFYSEVSMVGRKVPMWAVGERPVGVNRPYEVDPYRFRFFSLQRER